MEKIEILVVSKNPEILKTIIRLINQVPEWNGIGVLSVQEAMEKAKGINFRILLLGSGLEEREVNQLNTAFEGESSSTTIIQHYGGGSGLLFGEIKNALGLV